MADRPLVSVVIPTVGRETLWEALASAERQDVPTELIVVNDSGAQLDDTRLPESAHVINTSGREGVSNARNEGMAAARGTLVAFLDDDDVYLRGHLSHAVDVLTARPDRDLYSCRGLVQQGPRRSRIEPAELMGERTLAEYFYGHDIWRSRSRRVLTSTLVFRSRLRHHLMDTELTMSEDTWWLLGAESALNARMVQSSNVGIVMYASSVREGDRAEDRRRMAVAWARELDALSPGAGAAHLAASRGRASVRAGAPQEVLELGRETLRFRGGWRWLPALAAQTGVAAGIWAARRLGRVPR